MGRGGGGGGLRILPHKSWNVYGYSQQQRVKADEAKHAEETRIATEANQRAEAEFRIGLLRERARRRAAGEGDGQREGEDEPQRPLAPNGLEWNAEDDDEAAGNADRAPKRQRLSNNSAAPPANSKRPVRFVVQQEDEEGGASASAAAAAASSTAAASAPSSSVERFTLFDEATLGSSQQSAAMSRMRATDARAAEMKHMRAHAPTTLFVQAFRDEKGNDALRPWYARGEGERRAADQRQAEAHKRQVIVRPRTDGARGVQLALNTTGLPVHSVADPLDELRENLRQLDRHAAAKEGRREEQAQRLTVERDAEHAESDAGSSTSLVQQAIAQAKLQAAAALSSQRRQQHQQQQFSSPGAPSVPPMHRSVSASSASSDMPALQPASMWSPLAQHGTASASSAASAAASRRSRWDEPLQQPSLHYSSRVGFTNSASALMPNAMRETAPAPPPLFAAAGAAAAVSAAGRSRSRSASPSSASSSSSSSDSDSDSGDDGKRKRRRSSKRRRSEERSNDKSSSRRSSSSKKKKHKERKESKKSKKRKRNRSRSRSRSSGRRHSKVRSSSSVPLASGTASLSLPLPSAFAGAALKSSAELRAERQSRERSEREKAAALLQVPVWATAHPNSVLQRHVKDETPLTRRQQQQQDLFQGRPPSEFAYNRRS